MLGHVKEFQAVHIQQKKLFEKFQYQLEKDKEIHENHEDILMVLSFGQKIWEAYDNWCEEVSDVLEKRKGRE